MNTLDDKNTKLDVLMFPGNTIQQTTQNKLEFVADKREGDVAPGPNDITFPMIYGSNQFDADTGEGTEIKNIDLLRLVSQHDETIIAGMQAVLAGEDGEDLFFAVSSDDDDETLDTNSFGFRAGQPQTVDLTVRYHGADGAIQVGYVNPGTESTILATGGDVWTSLDANLNEGNGTMAQSFTVDTATVLTRVNLYLKRRSYVYGYLDVYIMADDGSNHPEGYPAWHPELALAHVQVAAEDISTTGDWFPVEISPGLALEASTRYYVVKNEDNITIVYDPEVEITPPPQVDWYVDDDNGYADGEFWTVNGAPEWTAHSGYDGYLKISTAGEETATVVDIASYDGWQEATLADIDLRFNHDFYESKADLKLTVPENVAINAVMIKDQASNGEVHYRAGHIRSPHIRPPHHTHHENGGDDELSVTGLSGLLADGQTPLGHHASHEAGQSDAITNVPNHDHSGDTGDGGVLTAAFFPKRATMWHDESTVIAGAAMNNLVDTNQAYGRSGRQDAAANADAFTNGCWLAAGTYTLYFLGVTDNSSGKIDWKLDNTTIATGQDWYTSTGINNVIKSVASVSVAASGWHKLTGTVNGKNGSSGGYRIRLTKYWFVQAAD